MKIREYQTVQKWFQKGKYKSEKRYVTWMTIICKALNRTPDEIISDIKTTDFPITEMENQHVKLTQYLMRERTKPYSVRSIDQRTNALHGFYRANGISTTPELLRQLKHLVWKTLGHKAKIFGKVATENTV